MQEFQAFVSKNQACSADDQCELIMPGCPFGCYAAVSASAKPAVQKKLADLHAQMQPRCAYRCIGPPKVECQKGVCSLREAE